MFDAVRNNKRIVQIFLVLITVPFALWGVDFYTRSMGSAGDVATVGKIKISQQEFQQSLREQQDRMRVAMGRDFNPAMVDTPEARQAVLDSMINQRVLSQEAYRSRVFVSDDQLRQFIASVPAFQDNGKFSTRRYESIVRGQGLSEVGFEMRLRQDLALQQLASPVGDGAFIAKGAADGWVALQRETREVAEFVVKPEQFVAQVKLAPDAVQKFYDDNRKLFETPEQIRADYVVLNPDALMESVTVSDEEIKRWYEGHADQYKQPEERRASHILIQLPKDATEEQRKAARAKIEELLKQVRQSPNDFAKLAKDQSQDPGSAANGGDLGFFSRGMMVKPFEDTAFALKEGQVSDVVTSDFGFHIIKVTGVKAEKARSLDEAKEEIRTELKRQGAARKFAEVAETFNNMVYEQSDSLKPVAEKFGLNIRKSGWLTKGAPLAAGELNSERLINALFSDDALKNKRNTEAIETAPNTLVAARVAEHKPAQTQPLDALRAEVEKKLTLDEAARLAQKDGAEKLARLLKGETVDVAWGAPKSVTRAGAPGLSADGLRAVFRLSADKLPRYAGGKLPDGGFGLYKLLSVKPSEIKDDDARAGALRAQLARLYGEEDFAAYMEALKSRYPVEVNKTALEAK
jgi:peptidyl-prolyl cis-trans isomerase D